METRRRESKSYLLRRELRQQKGVHSVSGRKAAIYTASILFPPVPAAVDVIIKLPCRPFTLIPLLFAFNNIVYCVLTRMCISICSAAFVFKDRYAYK